jgi:hypothetical protein
VVSVFANGTKGRGFNRGRCDGFLNAIKIRSTPSFGWEVKPEFPCRKILRLFAPDVAVGRTARELWWTSQELSTVGIVITMAIHARILLRGRKIGPLAVAVLRQSHSITINQTRH